MKQIINIKNEEICQKKIELLKHYEAQWQYRNSHYWKLVIMHTLVGITIILFPYLADEIGIKQSVHLTEYFFRIIGTVISAIFVWLLLCENARAAATRKSVIKLIKEIGSGQYNMEEVADNYKINIGSVIPWIILLFHIILAHFY